MGYVRFKGSPDVFQMQIKTIGSNMVQLYPPLPEVDVTVGFEMLTRQKGGKVYGNYLAYTTLHRKLEDGAVILSNDGSVWTEPVYKVTFTTNGNGEIKGELEQTPKRYEELVVPEVIPDENYEFIGWNPEIPGEGKVDKEITFVAQLQYVPTLEEVQNEKVAEMNNAQQMTIQQGLDITLSDGSVEHFTLTDHDQTSLMGLQTLVAQGVESIPWHTSDQAEHCKYYSNEDMGIITTKALQFVTFHVTYFRDLRICIRALARKEDVSNIFYGMNIPEEYQSEVLKDYLKTMEEAAGETVP